MPDQDRKLAFDNAALSLHLNAVILEKDFWVSWLLGLMFSQPELAPFLVFKGGEGMDCRAGRHCEVEAFSREAAGRGGKRRGNRNDEFGGHGLLHFVRNAGTRFVIARPQAAAVPCQGSGKAFALAEY